MSGHVALNIKLTKLIERQGHDLCIQSRSKMKNQNSKSIYPNAPGLSSGLNHPPLTGSVSRTHHARMDSSNHGKAEALVLKWDCFSSIFYEI
ncbi:hypothetical protein NC653_032340 [Populus alba x Populus x berolinensis]|uniref:Uncharacterized protein n=1 Tax=Populus alba x Populus x berolinensis TaxID=444605 RepID=A0AAD6LRL0_9ROSI|nr:hypothetical protein NC653_032340 [Populus alba x Populus x berolinensis]